MGQRNDQNYGTRNAIDIWFSLESKKQKENNSKKKIENQN